MADDDVQPTSTSPGAASVPTVPEQWWRSAVVYEVYPRSFADSDGDGEGDLEGLRRRLPYLADLGVDALWIAPWYPSPMADGGYDVSDYCGIHPVLGTLEDADRLVADAHALGIRIIVDLVANHVSDEHPWFTAALAAAPGDPARELFFFRDGRGPDGSEPPNNWRSAFGGAAWTRTTAPDGSPGQWFLHTFAPEQPDVNWDSAAVQDGFDDVLRFWLARGVDGFRVDAAPAMAKEPGLPDADYGDTTGFDTTRWGAVPHWDVDGVHDILRRWRALADAEGRDTVFVTESVVSSSERLALYVRPDEMHMSFSFDLLKAPWDAQVVRRVVDGALRETAAVGAPATWVLSSHDEVRHVTRYGRADTSATILAGGEVPPADLALGRRRSRAALLLVLALPGSVYLYQGEELGLPEVEDLPDEALQDPMFRRSQGAVRGRDGCRVPLPWSGDAPPYGFSPGGTAATWLPQPAGWASLTVQAQEQEPGSMLRFYRHALRLRREDPDLRAGGFAWRETGSPDVVAFDRGALTCVVNLGSQPWPLPGDLTGEPVLVSGEGADGAQGDGGADGSAGEVPGDSAVWWRRADAD
jgi:alpha-glucosidase